MSGLTRFEHLCVLVVGHRLGGVDLTVEQRDHVELLADEFDVGCRVETGLADGGEHFVFVAEAPVADDLAFEVGRRFDSGVDQTHLQGPGPLEDLGDVRDVSAGLAGLERLGDPCDREIGVAVGELGLRHDLDRTLLDLHVEALVGEEALVGGGVVAAELGLGEPLELQADRVDALAVGRSSIAARRRPRPRLGGFGLALVHRPRWFRSRRCRSLPWCRRWCRRMRRRRRSRRHLRPAPRRQARR